MFVLTVNTGSSSVRLALYAREAKDLRACGDAHYESDAGDPRARLEAFLDRHMGDMVIPFMALANGTSEVSLSRVTQHTLTNVKVAELLAGVKFEIDGELGGKGVLRATGLGLRNVPSVSPTGSTSHP